MAESGTLDELLNVLLDPLEWEGLFPAVEVGLVEDLAIE